MLAEDGAILYVGKSKRLRARLLGYFRCAPRDKGAIILRETRRIEWEYTPNEFAALLGELRLIKRFRPRFNVASKRDLRHYAFIRLTGGRVPKLTVARAGASGDGIYYGLSGAGARLWQLLGTPRSLAAIVDRLVEEYDVTRDELQLDLELLLESLRARGLVAIAPGPGT